MKNVELKNLGITIDLESFKNEYKEKNFAFFSLLDKAETDKSIKVYRGIEEEDNYYNLIVIEYNNVYNAFPEPLFLEYMTIEQLESKINIKEIDREEINKIIRSQREMSYIYLKNREDKAKLVLKLSKLTNGKLTKEEIEEIVNNTDITEFKINIIEDAKEFANKITLGDYDNGWRTESDKWCNVYFVDIKEIELEYSSSYVIDNGDFQFGDEESDPDFNINKKYAVLLVHYDSTDDEDEYELVIYIPSNKPYEIDKEIQYILDNFDI